MSDTTQENTSDTQRLARDLRLLVDDTEALLRHAVRAHPATRTPISCVRGTRNRAMTTASAGIPCPHGVQTGGAVCGETVPRRASKARSRAGLLKAPWSCYTGDAGVR